MTLPKVSHRLCPALCLGAVAAYFAYPSSLGIAQTDSSSIFPATSRQQALTNAKRNAGRTDPLAQIYGFRPFPSGSPVVENATEGKDKPHPGQPLLPPPNLSGQMPVPPPPPVVAGDDFPVSELPLPPDRPSIAAKLKLTGVIGNKAVFSITDKEAMRVNKWPSVLVLGPGDKFESIETVSVGADSAVLQEDGERSTKTLDRIR